MTTDDHDGDDRRQDRGHGDKPTRDARGRWLPKYCPNPKGRPKQKKKPKVSYDQSDIRIFGNTLVDIVANGQKETMDRRTALINKMFESAMKGRVSMQRFLYKEFERNDKRLAAARVHYDRLLMDWVINNPDYSKPDFDIPFEVEVEMASLEALLGDPSLHRALKYLVEQGRASIHRLLLPVRHDVDQRVTENADIGQVEVHSRLLPRPPLEIGTISRQPTPSGIAGRFVAMAPVL